MTDVTGAGESTAQPLAALLLYGCGVPLAGKGGTCPLFKLNKKHRRTHFAAKSPSLFRDFQLRSAVSLVCSIVALRLPPQTAAQSVPKILSHYSTAFFKCQRSLFPVSPSVFQAVCISTKGTSRLFSAVFPFFALSFSVHSRKRFIIL